MVLVNAFEAFGKSTVICWPGQTGEQAGGERAGKKIRFEQADVEAVRAEASLAKHVCLETVNRPAVAYGERMAGAAVRRASAMWASDQGPRRNW
jgi:putative ABC transport system permease protein